VCSREGAVDIKCLTQPSRTAREIACASNMGTPPSRHHIDPLNRLNCPNEDRTADAFGFTYHIYTVVHSVNEIDVAVTT